MFFEQLILAKKGPLGQVWLAAHWEKKITKVQVIETKIIETVDHIAKPRVPMALRLSGHLLLGVVRIYYKKVDYLYNDCSEAMVKIKMAFRPGVVDMDESVANLNAITMPEVFGDFEIILPGDINTDLLPEADEGVLDFNLANMQDITVPEAELIRHTGSPAGMDILSQADASSVASGLGLGIEDYLNQQQAEERFSQSQGDDSIPFEVPIVGPQLPPFPDPEIPQASWESLESSSVSEKDLAIGEMPELATVPRLRNKHYKVDRRTELSQNAMEKTIRDPRAHLRRLERAPPTRELMNLRQTEIEGGGISIFFENPMDEFLPPHLRALIQRTMHVKAEMELPEKTIDELMEQERADRRRADEADIVPPTEFPPIDDNLPPLPDQWSEPSVPAGGDTTGGETTGPSITGEEEDIDRREGLIITKRTAAMHQFLANKFDSGTDILSFENLFQGKKKRTVAIAFFEILNIRSKNCIDVEQREHYEDILISKTQLFDRLTV